MLRTLVKAYHGIALGVLFINIQAAYKKLGVHETWNPNFPFKIKIKLKIIKKN